MIDETIYFLPYSLRRFFYAILRNKKFRRLQKQRTIDTDSGYSYKPIIQNQKGKDIATKIIEENKENKENIEKIIKINLADFPTMCSREHLGQAGIFAITLIVRTRSNV